MEEEKRFNGPAVLPSSYWIKEKPIENLNTRETIIKDMMVEAIKKTKGNVTLAAKLLGVPRSTFYKRIHKFGL